MGGAGVGAGVCGGVGAGVGGGGVGAGVPHTASAAVPHVFSPLVGIGSSQHNPWVLTSEPHQILLAKHFPLFSVFHLFGIKLPERPWLFKHN